MQQSLTRFKLTISYDGTNYYGFQVQNDLPTIELVFNSVLKKIFNKEIKIYGSGRTDRKVHARGQVIHFDIDIDISTTNLKNAINSRLPSDIRVNEIEVVSNDFHSRFSVIEKEYRYYINTNSIDVFSTNYYYYDDKIDVDLLEEAISKFIGTHNFKGFCSAQTNDNKNFIKTINNAFINNNNGIIEIVFKGNGFLKYQVRRMVGLLIDISKNKKTIDTIDTILQSKDPRVSHSVAEPQGLYLHSVVY
ncbi:MAG: tRNA pseudouridine(38-40) synthase TruA [Anaeroplasmataceae bacterium]